jgi:murein DD-endopeptidase MepM/ murein hydrolase activator NlpD
MIGAILAALITLVSDDAARARVAIHPLSTPRPVATTDGRLHVAYELLITNYHADAGPLTLRRVEVSAGAASRPLAAFDAEALGSRIAHPGRPASADAGADPREIASGEHVVLYLWVALPPEGAPRRLHHRLQFRAPTGRERIVDAFPVDVGAPTRLVLGPPLRTGRWLVHEGPGRHTGHHWRSQLAGNGRVTIPQRFAIDFLGLDPRGRAVRTAPRGSANADWVGFGAEVIAVADGVVRDAGDGAPDRAPLVTAGPPPSTTVRGLYGNFVVLEVGGAFVHYAHLQQGSVRVTAGQRVRRGQVLGRVGNSGNTTGPHLHLHVSDRETFEESDGLPYMFGSVVVLGDWSAERALVLEGEAASLAPSAPSRRGLPIHGAVVQFGAAGPRAIDGAGTGR